MKNCKAWKLLEDHWLIKALKKQGFVIIHKSKLSEETKKWLIENKVKAEIGEGQAAQGDVKSEAKEKEEGLEEVKEKAQ